MSITMMRLDKTQVDLGYRDLIFSPSYSDSKSYNAEIIYDGRTGVHPGECYVDLDVPAVSLQFTGPNAIEAITILIEDLQKIKRALKRKVKKRQ